MSKIDGYSEYSCDVQSCDKHDYAQPNTDKADSYVSRERITDDGVPRAIMICSQHNEVYAQLVQACEAAYKAFEKDGTYELATKAEVEELREQNEQLQAQYEAMKKDRNAWIKKYDQLNAEFEEYKRTHPDTDGGEE